MNFDHDATDKARLATQETAQTITPIAEASKNAFLFPFLSLSLRPCRQSRTTQATNRTRETIVAAVLQGPVSSSIPKRARITTAALFKKCTTTVGKMLPLRQAMSAKTQPQTN